jgi:arsenate reductase
VRWYLAEPLSRPELTALLTKLGISPCELIRQGESEYKEFAAYNTPTAEACLELLLTYPHLMERPIIETADRAIVARPAERVWEIIEK